tara:strand:+ start:1878 stop:2357 length:480 start_codon:yes stop_codon:yes gene_type:complete
MTEQSFNYTPDETCEMIVQYLNLDETKSYCEPFSGNHNIFNLLPENKEYFEIQEGKDFFTCSKKYDVIITNPPYRDYQTDRKNMVIDCFEKCFDVANEKCVFLVNNKMFNSLTPARLQKWANIKWFITDICIINIPKWYGRYYIMTFEYDKEPLINWIK